MVPTEESKPEDTQGGMNMEEISGGQEQEGDAPVEAPKKPLPTAESDPDFQAVKGGIQEKMRFATGT